MTKPLGSTEVVPLIRTHGPAVTTRLNPNMPSNGEGGSPPSRLMIGSPSDTLGSPSDTRTPDLAEQR
jgi:hypothetical protein